MYLWKGVLNWAAERASASINKSGCAVREAISPPALLCSCPLCAWLPLLHCQGPSTSGWVVCAVRAHLLPKGIWGQVLLWREAVRFLCHTWALVGLEAQTLIRPSQVTCPGSPPGRQLHRAGLGLDWADRWRCWEVSGGGTQG